MQCTPAAELCGQRPQRVQVCHDICRVQASGEAVYTSDIGVGDDELYAALVGSTEALATLTSVDPSAALAVGALSGAITVMLLLMLLLLLVGIIVYMASHKWTSTEALVPLSLHVKTQSMYAIS